MRFDHRIMQFWAPDAAPGANGGETSGSNGGQSAGGNGEAQTAGRAGAGSATDEREPAWLAPRLKRAQSAGRESLLSELGIGPDEVGGLKDLLSKTRETESESQRLKRDLAQRDKELAQERAVRGALETDRRHRLVDEGLSSAIGKGGRAVNDPRRLVRLLSDPREPAHIGVGDDGSLVVIENGNPARGKDPAAFVREFLDDKSNAHWLAPVHPEGGAGSRQASAGGAGGTRSLDLKTASHADKAAEAVAEFKRRTGKA